MLDWWQKRQIQKATSTLNGTHFLPGRWLLAQLDMTALSYLAKAKISLIRMFSSNAGLLCVQFLMAQHKASLRTAEAWNRVCLPKDLALIEQEFNWTVEMGCSIDFMHLHLHFSALTADFGGEKPMLESNRWANLLRWHFTVSNFTLLITIWMRFLSRSDV